MALVSGAGIGPLYGGTRSDDRDPLDVTTNIVQAVKTYFELCPWSTIDRVYFLAYTDADDELLTTAFNRPRLNFDRDEAPIPAPASARNA